jgi:Ser/Thr protein kinase RdoA (MazF antagonist)
MKEKLFKVVQNWNIGKITSFQKVDSFTGRVCLVTTNRQDKYILKEKESFQVIDLENKVLHCLHRQGTPVAPPVATLDGELYVFQENRYYCLYPYLSGVTISNHFSRGAGDHAFHFGKSIGELHLALKQCKQTARFPSTHLITDIIQPVKQVYKNKTYRFNVKYLNKIINDLENNFSPLYELLPKQLIHRDLHPGNMLFEDKKVTGYLDFEMIARGPRIYDPCYCASAILFKNFKCQKTIQQWIDLIPPIIKGYNSKIAILDVERQSIFFFLLSIQLFLLGYHCTQGNLELARYFERIVFYVYDNKSKIEPLKIY